MSKVYVAFRFHTNFYHSYRGDTPDDLGFGMDIRIIRSILDDLDRLNDEGVPVMGTWDIENYYSLEKYIPNHSPDIIDRIKARIECDMDAVTPMSYNNGLVSAETAQEFDKNMEWTISNSESSGLCDLFSEFEGVVRPQECMYTPSHLKHYKKHGIDTISIYYSSHPFNGFSNFVEPLSFYQRYNPLTLKSKSTDETMTLLPAYNHGDIADNWLSLKNWVKQLRREQLKGKEQKDILLVIDMDADDPFWEGIDMPVVPKIFPSFDGLYRMVKSISHLEYISFTTPQKYNDCHEVLGEVYLEEDTADGSFDGLASWADKWENTQLWTRINAIRTKAEFVEKLYSDKEIPKEIRHALDNCMKQRVLSHSTTHFGLATPIMNTRRLKTANDIIDKASEYADKAFKLAIEDNMVKEKTIYLGGDSDEVLRRIQIRDDVYYIVGGKEIDVNDILENKTLDNVHIENNAIYNGRAKVEVNSHNEVEMFIDGEKINSSSPTASVTYNKKRCYGKVTSYETEVLGNDIGALVVRGSINIGGDKIANWSHRYILVQETPYIYVEVEIDYPETEHKGYNKEFAKKLQNTWNARYSEVMPFELCPKISGTSGDELEVVKHNFFGDVSSYKLDYYKYTYNRTLHSFNNHVTNGFVGIKNKRSSLFVAQSGCLSNNFAFCPMRLHMDKEENQTIFLNPFGTYTGKQKKYHAKRTGIGQMISHMVADHLGSYAPSYNGKSSHFMLMLCRGELTDKLKNDMIAFSTVPISNN